MRDDEELDGSLWDEFYATTPVEEPRPVAPYDQDEDEGDDEGGSGVREPRRPYQPSGGGYAEEPVLVGA